MNNSTLKNIYKLYSMDKNKGQLYDMGRNVYIWRNIERYFITKPNGYEVSYPYREKLRSVNSISHKMLAATDFSMDLAIKKDQAEQLKQKEWLETYWTIRFKDFHLLFTHVWSEENQEQVCFIEKSQLKYCDNELLVSDIIEILR